jgi:dipeptidyl aminopeptidase/acylaminoacyl peptidase
MNADNARKRKDAIEDGAKAAEYLASSGWVNPKKLIAMGGSYGGYMTLAQVAFHPELWAAGVDIVGISNFLSFLKNTGAWRARHRAAEYGDLEKDADFLKSVSPLNSAERIAAPMLVVQGANDPRVPKSEADQIVQSIRGRNGVVEYLLYPDEGHGLVKLPNRISCYGAIISFLDKQVKNK